MNWQFPDDFQWGVATAAYQIEGSVTAAGRLPSVWDTFSAIPGRIRHDATARIACEHYTRFPEDIQWMQRLGVKHYRFSIAWPRILPAGTGTVNHAGLDFYKRLVDELGSAGITPHATLFHWDSPQALEDRYGSWRSRQMAADFADYVAVVVRELCDRIHHWTTLNEIYCFTHLGYGVNQVPLHAPGTLVPQLKDVWQTSHHALLAHGLACQVIRATSREPCSVGFVDNYAAPVPMIETEEHIAAARKALPHCLINGGILYPVLTGEYPPAWLENLGHQAPTIKAGDLEIIHQPLDYLGCNSYTGVYVRAMDTPTGYEILDFPRGYPKLHMPWLHIVPESLYWGIRHISETLNQPNLPILITENGCATQDKLTSNREILDTDRIFYLRQSLKSAYRAIREGYPLKGYFHWTLMDNFEWAWGYDRRFGLLYTDYATQERIPKASFDWYAACIKQNHIV